MHIGNEDFAARVFRIRQAMELTQADFGRLLGVTSPAVSAWETGRARPKVEMWRRIVDLEREVATAKADTADATAGSGRGLSSGGGASSEDTKAQTAPAPDFSAPPEVVRAVAEAERLSFGHMFNPAFATETALIDPLPHQRIAVYDHMLPQTRLRFLLADDAGAGKTIMAGLYIREMLSRRLIRRVLIVPPAGLVGNWESEMRKLFSLPFRIVAGADARDANPFVGLNSDLVIVSLDTLAGRRMFERLRTDKVEPYDLVIFDEAHKLSADRDPDFTVRKTDRYRLGEALAGASTDPDWTLPWHAHHLLLLTATPHMGKEYPYFSLWRLLEPEVLSTPSAFHAYPIDARRRHFIRRTKEEMVRFDGTPIYPRRESNTVSYDLTEKEQLLYDRTTAYVETYYNRARILNRSAARMAMGVFQRRLASSTHAVARSFESRLAKLDALIEDVQSGKITMAELAARQRRLDVRDPLDEKTGEEEQADEGREENELAEEKALSGVVATTLGELQAERLQVEGLLKLAQTVIDSGDESKFEKLLEVIKDERFQGQKILIFTEHRDTLDHLVRRLEQHGYTGQIAQIHGGMPYQQREEQVEFFRRPAEEGGASFLVATDAAGEGINLQFCWLMINYDIPWNPARIEQRMGRIHRYKQQHDPVLLFNLVAGKTREGKVLKTLLDKMEAIRKELNSDKVFDVIGRQFEGVSLKDLILRAITEKAEDEVAAEIAGKLTKEQVAARAEQMEKLLGTGGDVAVDLPRQREQMEQEELFRLMPGYVRRFLQESAPLLDLEIRGDLDRVFSLEPVRPGALDPLWPVLETYEPEQRGRFTVYRRAGEEPATFLRPGDPFFDRYCRLVMNRYALAAEMGAVFVDPYAEAPYVFRLARISIVRQADPSMPEAFGRPEVRDVRLVGLRQDDTGMTECPVESLMFLRGAKAVQGFPGIAAAAGSGAWAAEAFVHDRIALPLAEAQAKALRDTLAERTDFVARGFDYQTAELAAARSKISDRARAGDPQALGELTKIRQRQAALEGRKTKALAILHREPDLIVANEVHFLAHALVIPSPDPGERRRFDREVEKVAVRVARAYEEARGCAVRDVSTAEQARLAGLEDWPGFDLLSRHGSGEERAVEVKGRAGVGEVELSENEWAKACNLRARYWLYVVYDCGTARPRLLRIQDPFGKLLNRQKGGVVFDEKAITEVAEEDVL